MTVVASTNSYSGCGRPHNAHHTAKINKVKDLALIFWSVSVCCLPATTDCRRFCHFVCFLFFLILYGAPAMSLTWWCHLNQYIVTYLLLTYPIKTLSSVKNILSKHFSMYLFHAYPFNYMFIVTFTDVRFTSLLA